MARATMNRSRAMVFPTVLDSAVVAAGWLQGLRMDEGFLVGWVSAPRDVGPYDLAMRRPPMSLLAVLCVCLLGSDCEIRVSNRPPPRPPPEDGEGGERPDGGLVVVIREGDVLREPPGADAVDALTDVSAAVATSFLPDAGEVLASGAPESSSAAQREPDPGPLEGAVAIGQLAVSREVPAPPSSAVPEPQGLLLFAAGLALSTLLGRRESDRPRPACSRPRGDA